MQFTIELLDDGAPIGFWGSRLRGGYGWGLMAKLCDHPPMADVRTCPDFGRCPYPFLFESCAEARGVHPVGKPLGNDGNLPVPFVIEPPPVLQSSPPKNSQLTFAFLALGVSCEMLRYTLAAFQHFGETGIETRNHRVRFRVAEVRDLLDGGRSVLCDDTLGSYVIGDLTHVAHAIAIDDIPDEITLEFITPTSVDNRSARRRDALTGRTLFDDFYSLVFNLAHRVGCLWQLFGENWIGQAEYFRWRTALLNASRAVEVTSEKLSMYRDAGGRALVRRSNRQAREQPLDGFTGKISFTGELSLFWELLRAGEILHVGRNTAHGLGQYKLIF